MMTKPICYASHFKNNKSSSRVNIYKCAISASLFSSAGLDSAAAATYSCHMPARYPHSSWRRCLPHLPTLWVSDHTSRLCAKRALACRACYLHPADYVDSIKCACSIYSMSRQVQSCGRTAYASSNSRTQMGSRHY